MLVMYEHSENRLVEQFNMQAAFHGVSLEGGGGESGGDSSGVSTEAPRIMGGISGDPDSFSHLSMEERQELTEKMMGRHKAWVEQSKPLGGKEPIDKR